MSKHLLYTIFISIIFNFLNISIYGQSVLNEIYSRGTAGDPDWIEIYNNSENPINIGGYKIYDEGGFSGAKPKKEIPAGTVLSGYGFYVILTQGTGDPSDFGLSQAGETVWLENASGQVIDTIDFPFMSETQSYGRLPDGSSNWQLLNTLTKGGPNSNEQTVAIVMNEIFSRGTATDPDWIEIFNKLNENTDLSGFKIYDNGGKTGSKPKKEFPTGSIIPANGFFVIITDDTDPSGFGLSSGGEFVWLENPSGIVIDSIYFPALSETQSFGRMPDGSPIWQVLETITKGSSNNTYSVNPINLSIIGQLPSVIYESSGIAITSSDMFWTHNDDDISNRLFSCDYSGQLLRTITISNVTRTDWEDLAIDDQKRIYIDDAGNNDNNRTNLAIYRIPNPDTITSDEVEAEIINFSFEDQSSFPPPPQFANFDIEAMIWFEDSLYLFTKDRSSPFSGYTKLYQLSAEPGTHVAKLIDSFYLGFTFASAMVTSADINFEDGTLALLTKERLFLFKNYPEKRFFDGEVTVCPFNPVPGQVEAIAFNSSSSLIMTEEGTFENPGKIYNISLNSTDVHDLEIRLDDYSLEQNYPNPFNPNTTISFSIIKEGLVTLKIYSILGQEVATLMNEIKNPGKYELKFDGKNLTSGVYLYRLEAGDYINTKKMIFLK